MDRYIQGYDYSTLAKDIHAVVVELNLENFFLPGFYDAINLYPFSLQDKDDKKRAPSP